MKHPASNALDQEIEVGMSVMYITNNQQVRKGVVTALNPYYNGRHISPEVKSWRRFDQKTGKQSEYKRELSGCYLVFPLHETEEQVKQWCAEKG